MSFDRDAIHRGVMPLFRRWHDAVGPVVAKQTCVCVVGGHYREGKGIRRTPVSVFLALPECGTLLIA